MLIKKVFAGRIELHKDSLTGEEVIDYDFLGKKLYPPKKLKQTDASKAFARLWQEIDSLYYPGKKESSYSPSSIRSGGGSQKQPCMVKMFYTDSKVTHRNFLREYMTQATKKGVEEKPVLFNDEYEEVPEEAILEYEKNMVDLGFKFIISPESQRVPMKQLVRQYVHNLEEMTGYKFRWFAATHTDTGHIHSHLLINGVDKNGKEVRFPPNVIKELARSMASNICTDLIGARSREQIENARRNLPKARRWTKIDERIAEQGGYVKFKMAKLVAGNEYEASKVTSDDTEIQRLTTLVELGLALKYEKMNPPVYYLEKNWQEKLRYIGRYTTYLEARKKLRWTPYYNLEMYSGETGQIEGIVTQVHNMDDEGVWNNAVIIENKRLGRAWYVPTRIKLSDEEIGKFISVRAEKNQKGKLRPLITIH